jgi:hypothetical protein
LRLTRTKNLKYFTIMAFTTKHRPPIIRTPFGSLGIEVSAYI